MKATLSGSFGAALIVLASILPKSNGFSVAPATRHVKDTKVSVDGRADAPITPPPHAASHNVTLSTYMRLPVEQYVLIPMPLGSSLTRIEDEGERISSPSLSEGTEFQLVVPTITFFKLSLQPVVYATVQPQGDKVVISSNNCILRGSPFIDKVKLNERFDFFVETTLTWEDALSKSNLEECDNPSGDPRHECSITAETTIDVDVDVPRPFSSIPKRMLERTGNAAMRLSLRYIQNNFVDNLAKDYAKWATDAEYREYRSSLSREAEAAVAEGEIAALSEMAQ